MKTRFLLVSAISLILFVPLFAEGLVIPRSGDEILDETDLIVVGTVSDVRILSDKPAQFRIDIEHMVKSNSLDSDSVVALGCDPGVAGFGTSCPSYHAGQRGLFLISERDGELYMSSESRVSDARCTAQEFLSSYRGFKPHFYWTQDGQSDVFFTGKPIEINFVVQNSDMATHDYSVRLSAHTGGFSFSDVVDGTIPPCVGFETATVSFVTSKMGTYGFNSEHGSGGDGSFGTAIIEHGSSPRQQTGAQIHAQDVWCKDDLFLILKNDNTKPRYDNPPACATKNTVAELLDRDWGFVPPESKYDEILGEKN